jgi:hypothetical protein
MTDDDSDELARIREMVATLLNAGEKELKRISELGVPRLVLGRNFGAFDPWTKEDLEQTFRKALSGNAAAEKRLLNSAGTSDDAASRYITWLYRLLFFFREHPEHLEQLDNVLLLGRECGIVTPASESMQCEPQPEIQPSTGGLFDGLPAQIS